MGEILGRERDGGYVAQSESIASSELRMAHAIYFLTSLKSKCFLFLVRMNFIFVIRKLQEIVLILFLLVFLIQAFCLVWMRQSTKHIIKRFIVKSFIEVFVYKD